MMSITDGPPKGRDVEPPFCSSVLTQLEGLWGHSSSTENTSVLRPSKGNLRYNASDLGPSDAPAAVFKTPSHSPKLQPTSQPCDPRVFIEKSELI